MSVADQQQTPSPREDLYRHVNGAWLENTIIPADHGTYGAFMELRDEAEEAVHAILTDAAESLTEDQLTGGPFTAGADDDAARQRIGALYTAFMDTERTNRRGLEPIIGDIGAIESASSPAEFLQLIGTLQRHGGGASLFGVGAMQDAGNPERNLLHLLQGGLGLPDESYYRDEKFADIRQAYQEHIAEMLNLGGIGGDPQEIADYAARVMQLETRIASHHWNIVDVRDAVKRYNLKTHDEVAEIFPLLDNYLAGLGIDGDTAHRANEIVVWQPDVLQAIHELLHEAPLDDWKLWAQFHTISGAAPYLTDELIEADFNFYGRQLAGTEENRDRWKRAVSFVNGAVGEDVARLYVQQHFPAGHKEQMDTLVEALLEAYRRSISSLEWMGEDTRQRALEKLSMFNPMVGYPVKWIDYSSVSVDARDLMGSVRASSLFHFDRDLSTIDTGPDPEEWHMTPQTVNAYYSPLENAIVFPAAILQPPFFDPEATPAQNFGGIGAVIGHEIGHGFDDQGSRYAGDGSLTDWWTAEDRDAFQERTGKLVDQYNALAPAEAPDHTVNGELTLGENIGDLGGLGIAHQALQIYLEEHPGEGAEDQKSIDQEFFTSWATVWRQLARREAMVTRIASDPHSPNEFRCNQVVKNLDAFHAAYDTEPGDPMWLDEADRVTIW